MKLRKSKLLIVLALILTLTICTTALANPVSNQNSSSGVQAQIEDIEAAIEEMDEHIMTTMSEIENTETQVEEKKTEIAAIEKEIEGATSGIKREEDLYKQRMRALYMDGMVDSYLQILITSTGFSDFISRLDTVITVMKYDSKLISTLKENKQEISLKKEALVRENNTLIALLESNEDKLQSLESKKDKQNELLVQLNRQKSQGGSSTNKAAVYQTYNEITGNVPDASLPSRGGSSQASGKEIVAFAMKYLGTPYVWGGTTPTGFDCSGFTKFVFGNFGITLNRVSKDQAKQGTAVSLDSLEPGDLIFYGSPVYHVGIYAGNGMMVHAPYRGDVVKIAAVRWQSVSTARRVR